eukprot:COSAG03_NODE_356_length_8629_cov_11.099965_5_plen_1197_part_00
MSPGSCKNVHLRQIDHHCVQPQGKKVVEYHRPYNRSVASLNKLKIHRGCLRDCRCRCQADSLESVSAAVQCNLQPATRKSPHSCALPASPWCSWMGPPGRQPAPAPTWGAHLHGALALVEGQVNRVHHNEGTGDYDLHNLENGGVGTQLGYEVVLGYVELYEAMQAGGGGLGTSADDNVHPPPAPSPFASKCPQGVLYLVTSVGRPGFPKGEQRRCISDGKKWRCEHGRERNICKPCGGSRICEHGRQRHHCKECGGASICEHGRRRHHCKECSGICEHGRHRSVCKAEECGGVSLCEGCKVRHPSVCLGWCKRCTPGRQEAERVQREREESALERQREREELMRQRDARLSRLRKAEAKAAKAGLVVGAAVTWEGSKSGVPRGAIGKIIEFVIMEPTNVRAIVEFPKGTWGFDPETLRPLPTCDRTSTSSKQEPGIRTESRPSKRQREREERQREREELRQREARLSRSRKAEAKAAKMAALSRTRQEAERVQREREERQREREELCQRDARLSRLRKAEAKAAKMAELTRTAAKAGLVVGAAVTWEGSKSGVPRGAIGKIIEFVIMEPTNVGRAIVEFPKGTWGFDPETLRPLPTCDRTSTSSKQEPGIRTESRPSKRRRTEPEQDKGNDDLNQVNVFTSHRGSKSFVVAKEGGIGASAGDNVHPPPAPSPFASKCPQGVLYLVTSTGRPGFPKGEQRRCISDGKQWRCEHGRVRSRCKECGGAGICEHGRRRSVCKECGGASICEHGRVRSQCKECGGAGICEHGRQRHHCKECGGAGICEHGRVRHHCKDCGGAGICEHGRRRHHCKDCGGASICEHGRVRYRCKECRQGVSSLRTTPLVDLARSVTTTGSHTSPTITQEPGIHTESRPSKRRRTEPVQDKGNDDVDLANVFTSQMCEGCNAKTASCGTPTERERRWCAGCGEAHGAVNVRYYPVPKPRQVWTTEEHKAFADALECYGRDWAQVARSVGTKTREQTRSHAQKHFKRLSRTAEAAIVPPRERQSKGRHFPARQASMNTSPPAQKRRSDPKQAFAPQKPTCKDSDSLCADAQHSALCDLQRWVPPILGVNARQAVARINSSKAAWSLPVTKSAQATRSKAASAQADTPLVTPSSATQSEPETGPLAVELRQRDAIPPAGVASAASIPTEIAGLGCRAVRVSTAPGGSVNCHVALAEVKQELAGLTGLQGSSGWL